MSAIIAALGAGAAALASGTLSEAAKDAYKALKQAVLRFTPLSDVEELEQKPGSQSRQGVLGEALDEAGKDEDPGLARLAQALIDALSSTLAINRHSRAYR